MHESRTQNSSVSRNRYWNAIRFKALYNQESHQRDKSLERDRGLFYLPPERDICVLFLKSSKNFSHPVGVKV